MFGETMFKIELVDIGGDGLITEANIAVDTLLGAEVLARELVCKALQTTDIELAYDEDLVYEVMHKGESVGVVAITSI